MKNLILAFALSICAAHAEASKEIAITFDDAPNSSSESFESGKRTDQIIAQLKLLNVPPVMIFANPCKQGSDGHPLDQLRKYAKAGHQLANHSCTHPQLDKVGVDAFIKDVLQADQLLQGLLSSQKMFRYPFFNEGRNEKDRQNIRDWLTSHDYENGVVTIDDDDYLFAQKLNQAKKLGRKIDYEKLKSLYLEHMLGSVKFYDDLAQKTLGRSPKHVMLMHEVDTSALFLKDLVSMLRRDGWTFISAEEAYKDPVYSVTPKSLPAGSGLISQIAMDKTGTEIKFGDTKALGERLDKELGITAAH